MNQRKRTSSRTSRGVLAAAAVLIAASLAVPATTAADRGPMTFQGQCHFVGRVTFNPAMTNDPQDITQHVRAPGTCNGTLTDSRGRSHDLQDAPVDYVATEFAPDSSCSGGTAEGTGKLVFQYGSLRFLESETRAGVFVTATATGREGGSASGTAEPTPDQDPAEALQRCAGKGIQSAKIAIDLVTTPSISG